MRTINKKTGIGLTAFLFLSLIHCQVNKEVKYRVIRVENGWGYELYSGEKIIIHQEIIPVIEGKYPFLSRQDAQETGKLALHKLFNGEIPIITRHDLDSLRIVFPDTKH